MESDFLKRYYQLERTHWWFIVREQIISQQLRKSLPVNIEQRILNTGAATGKTTELLQEFGKVTSVEIDHDTCEFLKNTLHITVTEASVTALPFENNSFDVVCAFDVLEHVQDDVLAIKELKRVCKPGGMLFVTAPAFSFLWSNHDIVNHHYRRYTAGSLKALIEHGFQVQYLTFFNTILFLPIACYRVIRNVITKGKKAQSDFEGNGFVTSKWTGWLCKKIFGVEIFLLRYIKFPFGISLLASAKKA